MATMREEAEPFIEPMKRSQVNLKVRFPPMLFAAMKTSAKRNCRSLNAEVIYQLLKIYDTTSGEPSNIERLMKMK